MEVDLLCKGCQYRQKVKTKNFVSHEYAIVRCQNPDCESESIICLQPDCRYNLLSSGSLCVSKWGRSSINVFKRHYNKAHGNNRSELDGESVFAVDYATPFHSSDDEEASALDSSDDEEVLENDLHHVDTLLIEDLQRAESLEYTAQCEAVDQLMEQLELDADIADDQESNKTAPTPHHLDESVESIGYGRLGFLRDKSTKYYSQEQIYFAKKMYIKGKDNKNDAGGYQGLVNGSNKKDKFDLYGFAEMMVTKTIFYFHQLVLRIGGKDQMNLIRYENAKEKLLNIDSNVRKRHDVIFPKSPADIRAYITSGPYSIMKNFPCPKVFRIGNHACVGLKETILIMAGHQGDFNFAYDGRKRESNHEGLNGTTAVKEVIADVIQEMKYNGYSEDEIRHACLGYFYFWSDSFLRCFVKQKDNSVWILTVTVCPPQKEISTGKYTFVLAMGRSGADHTPVFEHYYKEAYELMKGFKCYLGISNDIVDVGFGLLNHLADRPERKLLNQTRKEGDYGKVTGYAVFVNPDKLAACKHCQAVIVRNALDFRENESRKCSRCLCWSIWEGHDPSMYGKAPKDYPDTPLAFRNAPKGRSVGLEYIGPVKQTSEFMQQCCIYAYEAKYFGLWTKANIHEYLRSCNVTQSRIDFINKRADEDRKKQKMSNPESYLPQVWSSQYDMFKRFRLPDTPLHAIAHGMIPDVMDAIHQIFAHWGRFSNFVTFANRTINVIAALNLDWIKVKKLPKAAWIGENEMAFARLMPFLYGSYFINGSFNKEVRGTILDIVRLLNGFHTVVSCLMANTPVRKEEMSVLLKLLLSCAHQLQSNYGSLKSKDNQRKGKLKSGKVLNALTSEEVVVVAKAISITGKDATQLKNNIERLTASQLADKIKELNPLAGTASRKKEDLQCQLFGSIIKRPVIVERFMDYSSNDNKPEGPFWNKGAWLSLLVNAPDQIEYLGQMRLIWLVHLCL